jgi:hypothetical protein
VARQPSVLAAQADAWKINQFDLRVIPGQQKEISYDFFFRKMRVLRSCIAWGRRRDRT